MFENVRVCYIQSQGQNLYSQIPNIKDKVIINGFWIISLG